jgi:hypothetical protein
MSTQAEVTMPDPQTFLLPSRAYVLSMRDQNVPMREAALADALEHFEECAAEGGYVEQLALVALIGEALQIVEDLGALASSLLKAPAGTAFFAALTNYNRRTVNNFYAGLHKRPDDDFLRLLGFRLGEQRLEDAFVFDPPLNDNDLAALDEAHIATARLVRRHLTTLAAEWERYRRFHHAFKHGFLVANPEDVELVENRSERIDGIVVWRRFRPGAEGFGQIEPPYAETADYVARRGRLALDVLRYLVDTRVNVFELADFRADGTWTLKPMRQTPWLWWFDKNDVAETTLTHLSKRFGVAFD